MLNSLKKWFLVAVVSGCTMYQCGCSLSNLSPCGWGGALGGLLGGKWSLLTAIALEDLFG